MAEATSQQEMENSLDWLVVLRQDLMQSQPWINVQGKWYVLFVSFQVKATTNMHSWYGFMAYPSLSKSCSATATSKAISDEFETLRNELSFLYHNDTEQRTQIWNSLIAAIFIVFQHIASFIFSIVACVFQFYCCGELGVRNMGISIMEMIKTSGGLGMLLGSVFFPLLFYSNSRYLKVIAGIGIHMNEEYYSAPLFRKSTKEFVRSFFMNFLYDFLPLENDADCPEGGGGADGIELDKMDPDAKEAISVDKE